MVGLIDQGWNSGGSFGTVKAVEVAVVSVEAAGRTCFVGFIRCDVDGGAEGWTGAEAFEAVDVVVVSGEAVIVASTVVVGGGRATD